MIQVKDDYHVYEVRHSEIDEAVKEHFGYEDIAADLCGCYGFCDKSYMKVVVDSSYEFWGDDPIKDLDVNYLLIQTLLKEGFDDGDVIMIAWEF